MNPGIAALLLALTIPNAISYSLIYALKQRIDAAERRERINFIASHGVSS